MNELLDKHLCEKYPKIFSERNLSPQDTCMCWGLSVGQGWYSLIDILCNRIQNHIDDPPYIRKTGWRLLKARLEECWNWTVWSKAIYPFVKNFPINEYSRYSRYWCFHVNDYEKPPEGFVPQVVFQQVKEKLSGLRIYASGGDAYTRALISFSESISYRVCEVCGKMDDSVGRNRKGWITTTCEEHAKDSDDFVKNNVESHEIWKTIKKEKKNES